MRVCYIVGTGRSGSTLLERLLGQMPGVVAVGEIIDIWWRGVVRDERCGCGTRFHACPFWTEVGERAFGGWEPIRGQALHRVQDRLVRHAHRSWLTGRLGRRDRAGATRLLDSLARLYDTIARVSGASVVVDASKRVSYAGLLHHAGLSLRVVNLVRDPRAVAYSMTRLVPRPHPASEGEIEYMHTRSVPVAALEWVVFNELVRVLRAKGLPVLRVRYEDFVTDPPSALTAVLRHAGAPVDEDEVRSLASAPVDLVPTHGISGNPMRFRHGAIDLRVDDSWKTAMPRTDRLVATVLTAPLLRAYGYRSDAA
ncbi:MAG: sulfotransferase family protein [Acidimicrobiia bacterium]|nr:MAG: sulfotransferase family protein [Acidimicrobiia bacterium]